MIGIFKEIVSRRNLLWELVIKDLKLRYARLGLGFLWAFLSPLVTVTIFYFVFSFLLKIKIQEAPFFLYLMSAIFPWGVLQDSVNGSVDSLISNKNLLRESRFPHYFIPLSKVLANTINFLPALVIVIVASFFALRGSSEFLIFLPVVAVVHLILTFGLALIFSIIYLRFRDVKHIVELALTLIFYMTPVFYSIYLVKETLPKYLFGLYIYNPFVGLLIFYRIVILKGYYSFIYKDAGLLVFFFVPVIFSVVILYAALLFYEKNKGYINDYLSY
ncbi:MAG: ABC transporter permease [Candidatus Omnitrophota bacterium]|jgi:ABC-2 type transport system permease protein